MDHHSAGRIFPGYLVYVCRNVVTALPDQSRLRCGDMLKIVSIHKGGWAIGLRVKVGIDPRRIYNTSKTDAKSGAIVDDEEDTWAFPQACVCRPSAWKWEYLHSKDGKKHMSAAYFEDGQIKDWNNKLRRSGVETEKDVEGDVEKMKSKADDTA